MQQFKKAQVIMLPTDKETYLFIDKIELYLNDELDVTDPVSTGQHLYIGVNEKVKEGEYGLLFCKGISGVGRGYSVFYHDDSKVAKLNALCEGTLKIIATTDTSLNKDIRMLCKTCKGSGGIPDSCVDCNRTGIRIEKDLLPQLSTKFIDKFINKYNKGKAITKIVVKYEQVLASVRKTATGLQTWDYRPTINLRDNTITIKKCRNSYGFNEVKELCKQAWQSGFTTGSYDDTSPSGLTADMWVDKNIN